MNGGGTLTDPVNDESKFYEQALLSAGVMAGILFAVLVFVYQQFPSFEYPLSILGFNLTQGQNLRLLICLLGGGSSLLAASAVNMIPLAGGGKRSRLYRCIVNRMFDLGVFAGMVSMLVIMLHLSVKGVAVILVIDAISIIIFLSSHRNDFAHLRDYLKKRL